jgi:predicted MFS family arabinose efflux permease
MKDSNAPAGAAGLSGPDRPVLSTPLTLLLAGSCGAIAANLYYSQPLIDPISRDLGMSPETAGLIVTLTQVGYGLGLMLIVPLADRMENRRLILIMIAVACASLLISAMAPSAWLFLTAALLIGIGSVAVQVIVPYASHMAPDAVRGRVVGNVMSGLMLGIMLARPISSIITEFFSWHVVYVLSAGLMVVLAFVLWRVIPPRRPKTKPRYGELLASMRRMFVAEPVLRRRAFYQAAMFGGFSLFWTAVPLYLLGPAFGFTQGGVAAFALAGAAGAVAAPLAGRFADRGWSRPGTVLAMVAASAAYLVTLLAPAGSMHGVAVLVLAAIVIDFSVAANLLFGQRAIYMLNADLRGRINGIYMATFFMGGALCSGLGAWVYVRTGWTGVALLGAALPLLALAYFATERR